MSAKQCTTLNKAQLHLCLAQTTITCKVAFVTATGDRSGMLASASTGGTIFIWDVGKILHGHQVDPAKKTAPLWSMSYSCSQVTSLEVSPSGRWLAVACLRGELYLIERVSKSSYRQYGFSESSATKMLVATKSDEQDGEREEEWMHARVVNMVPSKTACDAFPSKSNVMAAEHIGPSLVVWLTVDTSPPTRKREEEEEKEHASDERSSLETATNVAEILVGVHGPTQRWISLCPSSGLRYRTIASSLESSMSDGGFSGDTRPSDVQRLLVYQGTSVLTISTTDQQNAKHVDMSSFF